MSVYEFSYDEPPTSSERRTEHEDEHGLHSSPSIDAAFHQEKRERDRYRGEHSD